MKVIKRYLVLSLTSFLFVGCFGGKNADPLKDKGGSYVSPDQKIQVDSRAVTGIETQKKELIKRQKEYQIWYEAKLKEATDKYELSLKEYTNKQANSEKACNRQKDDFIKATAEQKTQYDNVIAVLKNQKISLQDSIKSCENSLKEKKSQKLMGLLHNVQFVNSRDRSYTFTEGREGEIQITAKLLLSSAKIKELKINEAPSGLEIVKTDDRHWKINWTPNVGIISSQNTNEFKVSLELIPDYDTMNTVEANYLKGSDLVQNIVILVKPTTIEWDAPMISVTDTNSDLTWNQSLKISVNIQDPSTQVEAPLLQYSSGDTSTGVTQSINGAALISLDASEVTNPKQESDGSRTYFLVFHSSLVPISEQLDNTIARFKFISGSLISGKKSIPVVQQITIKKEQI